MPPRRRVAAFAGMVESPSVDGSPSGDAAFEDQATRSPWIAQLAADGPPRPLAQDTLTDVVIVGAGIAGVATAFFALRDTTERVLLVERDRVGRGATGRNAGQLTTYFERPLCDIADEFGAEMAAAVSGRVRRCARPARPDGRRERGVCPCGTVPPGTWACSTSTTCWCTCAATWYAGTRRAAPGDLSRLRTRPAGRLAAMPAELDGLYTLVPQATDPRPPGDARRPVRGRSVGSPKGCANSGRLVQQDATPSSSSAIRIASSTSTTLPWIEWSSVRTASWCTAGVRS